MKPVALAISLLVAGGLGWTPVAQASGGLYRCMVGQVPTFTDKAVRGAKCKALKPPPPPPRQPMAAADGPSADTLSGEALAAVSQPPLAAAPRGLPPLPPGGGLP